MNNVSLDFILLWWYSVIGDDNMSKLYIYHGSDHIVGLPKFGSGKSYNDYGLGFYCTETIELAKEWACY